MIVNELYQMARQIERASNIRNLGVEFCFFTVWFDADEYCAHDSMKEFLIDHCELSEEHANLLVNRDFRFVGAEDLAAHCLDGQIFDKVKYESLSRLAMKISDEAAVAAMQLGLDLKYAGERFVGKYDSFIDFVEERFDELYLEQIPQQFHNYINYEAVQRDWLAGGYYDYKDGFVFESN